MGGGGEDAHVSARLGDDRAGQGLADAGDLGQAGGCGHDERARPGVRGPLAAGCDALGCGDGVEGGGDLVVGHGDLPVQEGDVVQAGADELAVAGQDLHALQCLADRGAPARDLGGGQRGQGPGVVLAVGDGLQDGAGRLGGGQGVDHGRQLDEQSFQEFLQPLPLPRPVPDGLEPGAGQVPQGPDLRRGNERGPQQAHLRQPGQPLGIEPAGLRPTGELAGVPGVDQADLQAGGLQQVEPQPPVVAGYLGLRNGRPRRRATVRFVGLFLCGGRVICSSIRDADSRPQSSSGRYPSSLRF